MLVMVCVGSIGDDVVRVKEVGDGVGGGRGSVMVLVGCAMVLVVCVGCVMVLVGCLG